MKSESRRKKKMEVVQFCDILSECTQGHYYFWYSGAYNLDDNFQVSGPGGFSGLFDNRRIYVPLDEENVLSDFGIDYGDDGDNLPHKIEVAKMMCFRVITTSNIFQKQKKSGSTMSSTLKNLYNKSVQFFRNVKELKSLLSDVHPGGFQFFTTFRQKINDELSDENHKILNKWHNIIVTAKKTLMADSEIKKLVFKYRRNKFLKSPSLVKYYNLTKNQSYKKMLINAMKKFSDENVENMKKLDEFVLEHCLNLTLLNKVIQSQKDTDFNKEFFHIWTLYMKLNYFVTK